MEWLQNEELLHVLEFTLTELQIPALVLPAGLSDTMLLVRLSYVWHAHVWDSKMQHT